MQINNDCIRSILLYLQENLVVKFDKVDLNKLEFNTISWAKIIDDLSTFPKEDIVYSLHYLTQAGFIQGNCTERINVNNVSDITYNGHLYLKDISESK